MRTAMRAADKNVCAMETHGGGAHLLPLMSLETYNYLCTRTLDALPDWHLTLIFSCR